MSKKRKNLFPWLRLPMEEIKARPDFLETTPSEKSPNCEELNSMLNSLAVTKNIPVPAWMSWGEYWDGYQDIGEKLQVWLQALSKERGCGSCSN